MYAKNLDNYWKSVINNFDHIDLIKFLYCSSFAFCVFLSYSIAKEAYNSVYDPLTYINWKTVNWMIIVFFARYAIFTYFNSTMNEDSDENPFPRIRIFWMYLKAYTNWFLIAYVSYFSGVL